MIVFTSLMFDSFLMLEDYKDQADYSRCEHMQVVFVFVCMGICVHICVCVCTIFCVCVCLSSVTVPPPMLLWPDVCAADYVCIDTLTNARVTLLRDFSCDGDEACEEDHSSCALPAWPLMTAPV